jgi:hypothetical protein
LSKCQGRWKYKGRGTPPRCVDTTESEVKRGAACGIHAAPDEPMPREENPPVVGG